MKTKDKTAKTSNQSLVPKLRFPEFQNAAEWFGTTIGDIGSFYYGKSAPKWSLEEDAPTQCVRYGELYTKFGAIITGTYSRTNIDPTKLRFSKGGEILVPRVGEKPEDFGKCCCYLPLENIAIGEMISVFETAQNPLFYTYYFRNLYRQFAKVVEGQNVKNLYYVELEPLPIHRPPLPEQQKIADCLSSLDELIAAQAHKLDTLKSHKKGLMQQLFPAPGQITPTLRFPEFRDTGEWKEVQLGNIVHFASGGTPSKSNPDYWGGTIPWISASSMYDINIQKSDLKITQYAVENGARMASKGSLLILVRGSMLFNRVPIGITTVDVSFNQDIKALTLKKGELKHFILYQLLAFENRIPIDKTGIGAGKIELDELKRFVMFLPKDTDEQQKIADCFSSLDELIATQAQKLDTLKAHKKGLMQQLFPNPDKAAE
ncbi:restriction endonuclease subunit S [Desulfobacter postgatei]|uniref:Restriction endonuclease S subunit n=1 Tax=Desulfobacter postgatei 2ac9 TaxID=879212 RepID=I5B069_9BACT|nr:restriction endonuclease subunit S [Desulfobacter postgatei]EIM62882.1 restriction endonuclease S subunit [Desulfobacter postgatei 2ac9]